MTIQAAAKKVREMMRAHEKRQKQAAKEGFYLLAEEHRIRSTQCEVVFNELQRAGVFDA
jgi:hypothetical protein